jgi:hypothetical protein
MLTGTGIGPAITRRSDWLRQSVLGAGWSPLLPTFVCSSVACGASQTLFRASTRCGSHSKGRGERVSRATMEESCERRTHKAKELAQWLSKKCIELIVRA